MNLNSWKQKLLSLLHNVRATLGNVHEIQSRGNHVFPTAIFGLPIKDHFIQFLLISMKHHNKKCCQHVYSTANMSVNCKDLTCRWQSWERFQLQKLKSFMFILQWQCFLLIIDFGGKHNIDMYNIIPLRRNISN